MRSRLVALALVVLLAGCASPASPPGGRPGLAGYELGCLPDAVEVAPDVCARLLEETGQTLLEPSLAIDPRDPASFAVAAQGVTPQGVVQGRLFATTDGGATWTSHAIPLPPEYRAGSYYSDPSIAFAPDGTLHVTGLAIDPASNTPSVNVFHVATADGGAAWGDTTLLTDDGRNDRNWVSVRDDGTVFVSSQHFGQQVSKIAWSADGGGTWERLVLEGCFVASPVAFVRGEAWFGCTEPETGGALYRVDTAAKAAARLGATPAPCIQRLLAPGGDILVVTDYCGYYARSEDAGRTWASRGFAPDLVTIEDDWGDVVVQWSTLDPAGLLHLEMGPLHRLSGNDAPSLGAGALGYVQGEEHRMAYVVLDPVSGMVVQETRLTPEGPESQRRPPASLVPSLGDDWNGIEFAGAEGLMTWSDGGAIHVTRLVPQ